MDKTGHDGIGFRTVKDLSVFDLRKKRDACGCLFFIYRDVFGGWMGKAIFENGNGFDDRRRICSKTNGGTRLFTVGRAVLS